MNKFYIFSVLAAVALAFSINASGQSIDELEASGIVRKADGKLRNGDIKGAVGVLDKAIDEKKDLFDVYKERSLIRRRYLKDYLGAIADLDKALELKPDSVDLYIKRAYVKKTNTNDFQGALDDYQAALKYQPDDLTLYRFRAEIKSSLKDDTGAIKEIEAAIAIDPEYIVLHIDMSKLLVATNREDEALNHLQTFLDAYSGRKNGKLPKVRGVSVSKDLPDDVKQLTESDKSVRIGKYTRSSAVANSWKDLKNIQNERETAESLAKVYVELGKLYISKKDNARAFANLNTATEIDRNQEEAYGLRGVLYLYNDEYEKAIKELTGAIELLDAPYFYLNRGIAYLSSANDKKAQNDFDKFLKLYPDGKAVLDRRIAEAKKKIQLKTGKQS